MLGELHDALGAAREALPPIGSSPREQTALTLKSVP
jgi:hypothetical protein